jgi:hypothetical protein
MVGRWDRLTAGWAGGALTRKRLIRLALEGWTGYCDGICLTLKRRDFLGIVAVGSFANEAATRWRLPGGVVFTQLLIMVKRAIRKLREINL